MNGASFHRTIEGHNIIAGTTIHGGNIQFNLLPARPDTPPNPLSTSVPFSRDPNFVPRGNFLDTVHRLCSQPAGRAALVGLGGVGKSQLAIEYAHQLKDRTDIKEQQIWVFWVHASTIARIEESFKTIVEATKVPDRNQPNADIKKLIRDWLSNENKGKWCIILDSADDIDVLFSKDTPDGQPLASYLPQSRNRSILITTRNRDLAYRLTGNHRAIIEVGVMIEIDALKLLENRLGHVSTASTAANLVQALDYILLAIT